MRVQLISFIFFSCLFVVAMPSDKLKNYLNDLTSPKSEVYEKATAFFLDNKNLNHELISFLFANLDDKRETKELEAVDTPKYTVGDICLFFIKKQLLLEPKEKLIYGGNFFPPPSYLLLPDEFKKWWKIHDHISIIDLQVLILKERIELNLKNKNLPEYQNLLEKELKSLKSR